ncbi:hypothetical protein BDV98DRAFT_587247, partial [Pterulicium gracile]
MRDSKYIKFHCEVDKYAHCRHQKPVWEWRIFYGQLQRVVQLSVDLSTIAGFERKCKPVKELTMAIIRPVKHEFWAPRNTPYWKSGDFRPLVAIDVDDCAVRESSSLPSLRYQNFAYPAWFFHQQTFL